MQGGRDNLWDGDGSGIAPFSSSKEHRKAHSDSPRALAAAQGGSRDGRGEERGCPAKA